MSVEEGLSEFAPQWKINDDCTAIAKRPDRVRCITRNDRYHAGARNVSCAVDGYLQLALDYFVNFLLRVEVLVDSCTAFEVIMRERHAPRVEVASVPAGQTFDDLESTCVNERHQRLR
jgi:hypothetical protein